MFLRLFFLTILFAAPIFAETPVLSLPIDCTLGETCFVQQYMDVDPSDGVRDFGGGRATYNEHGGTDIRLQSSMMMEQGVIVLASAAGRVSGFQNDITDRAAHTDADRAALKGKDCGNGVEIDHGDGWKTKYCHMKQDSITVRKGQRVAVGDVLGQVGLSGRTQVAHLHITVLKDGVKIDPFALDNNLWADELRGVLAYQPTQIINIGFANRGIGMADVEAGRFETYRPTRRASALVGFVQVMNMVKGDQIGWADGGNCF